MILRGKKKQMAIKLHELREEKKRIDKEIADATNELKESLALGSHKCGDYEVGYVKKSRTVLDKEKLKADLKTKFKKYNKSQEFFVLYVTKKSA